MMCRPFTVMLVLLAFHAPPADAQPKKKDDLEPWLKQTKTLPAEERIKAALEKLAERNPGFPVEAATFKVIDGKVDELAVPGDYIADLSPLRALPELRKLNAGAREGGKGKIKDLVPLKDLRQLTVLNLEGSHGVT